MNDDDDPVYSKLGMSPIPVPSKSIELIAFDKTNGELLEDDLDIVRDNVNQLLEKGLTAFEEIAKIAKTSQDTKAYRELSVLLKVLGDTNKTLLDVTRARHEIVSNKGKVVDDAEKQPQVVNQTANFYGSTTDAIEMMRNKTIDGTTEN